MNYKMALSSTQLLHNHPVLKCSNIDKRLYFSKLKGCIAKTSYAKRLYVRRQLQLYAERFLANSNDLQNNASLLKPEHLALLPIDIVHILGYDSANLMDDQMEAVIAQLYDCAGVTPVFTRLVLDASLGDKAILNAMESAAVFDPFHSYFNLFSMNLEFVRRKPFTVLVTATMSAGKSTFINALIGKKINRAQNMACTGKIHSIIGKKIEDGFISEYDYDLVFNAGPSELMEDNEKNKSDQIIVSTYFRGHLAGKRIVIQDTPGVNSNRYPQHRELTEKVISEKKYDMMIVLLDATQLHTGDMFIHMKYIKENAQNKPILFVLNNVNTIYRRFCFY